MTVDGATRPLPDPFLLIATENPIEQDGTYALPEAQLDRFLMRTSLGYPSVDEEIRILDDQIHGHPLGRLRPVAGLEDLRVLREAVEHVYIDPLVKRWAVDLVRATRELPFLELGASVRASLALDRVSRAWALADGRDYVVPEDVERLFEPVVSHRMLLGEELARRRERLARRDRPSRLGGVSRARAPARARLGRRDAPSAMSDGGVRPFALVPRRRFSGVHPGALRTRQRGEGDEAAGSRPYRPGDRISWVDWAASARLSAARGSDELVVREFFAEQAPRAVIVCDRRPSLGIYGAPLPWLDKPAAIAEIVELVRASARAARGDVGLVSANARRPVLRAARQGAVERLARGAHRRAGRSTARRARPLARPARSSTCRAPGRHLRLRGLRLPRAGPEPVRGHVSAGWAVT